MSTPISFRAQRGICSFAAEELQIPRSLRFLGMTGAGVARLHPIWRLASFLLLALAVSAPAVRAQDLTFTGLPGDPASLLISSILERGEYTRIDRDTTLAAETVIRGDLVIVGAVVRLSGRVEGSVAILGGELFIRPGAVITGEIAVADGAVYPSRLATTGPVLSVAPETAVAIGREEGAYDVRLAAPPPPRRIRPTGAFGLALPLYDRVNGLTLGWGTRLLLTRSDDGAFARVGVTYRTELASFGGRAALEIPVTPTGWLVGEVSRGSVTNERWIRGDLANSAAAIAIGSDARDYHESNIASLSLVRRPTQPLVQGESFLAPRIVARVSRDRSLSTGNPWKLLGEGWRENPGISDGTLASVSAGASYAWRGITAAFDGDAAVEWAPGVGDFEFVQLVADGRWGMQALWSHRIDLRGRTMVPLGPHAAPAQRWSFVGGPGTLPTLEYGARRGDHLVFLRSDYSVPVPRATLPYIGMPTLRGSHAVGSAWISGAGTPRWDQNLGAGIVFPLLEAMVWVDPVADPLSPVFALGITLPR